MNSRPISESRQNAPPVEGYGTRPGWRAPTPNERPGFWQLRQNDELSVVRADQDGPTDEDWRGYKPGNSKTGGTKPKELSTEEKHQRAALAHTIQDESAWGVPVTMHAAAQRLLWEGLAGGDGRIVHLALEAGANPHEPSWSRLDSGPTDWDTPLAWLFAINPTHINRPMAFRRDLFDLLWAAGGRTDPRPDSSSSGLASGWIRCAGRMDKEDVIHVGRALRDAHRGKRAGEPKSLGLLSQRNEDGWTPIDQALGNGCQPVLEFLEDVCRELDVPLSALMNQSCMFRAPAPSIMALHYGLIKGRAERKELEARKSRGPSPAAEAGFQEQMDRMALLDQTMARVGQAAVECCPWDMWRGLLPDRTIPLTCLMDSMGAAAGLKAAKQCAGFNWEDRIVMSQESVRALSKWRRGILGINQKRQRDLGFSAYGWRRGAASTNNSQGEQTGSWMYRHPVMKPFGPLLERSILQTVQDFALDNHELAKSADPADRARVERARLTIFERSVKGPEHRATGPGPRRI